MNSNSKKSKPKVLFWVDMFFLHFCIANQLQKEIDSDFFAIIDVPNNPKKFFLEQKIVNFKKSWFYHNHIHLPSKKIDIEYLSSFEKKYDIDLWKLAINERLFYRFNRFYKFKTNEILSILEQECKLFEKILDDVKPDYFLTYDPPLHHSKLLYDLCRKKGIKVLGMYIPRVGGRCVIATDGSMDLPENLNGITGKNRTFEELRTYRESFNYTKNVNNYISGRGNKTSNKIKALFDYILKSDSNNTKTHYSYFGRSKSKVIIDTVNFLIKRKIRYSFIEKNLQKQVDLNKKFIYFPLSVDEEFNLLHYAPFYTNQIEVIRHVAKSLPIDYTLYVKEHPAEIIRGWRTISDYKEILDIPNTHLIHPSYSSEKLCKNCSLIFTIRGTPAFDAIFYQKSSITLGDVPYSLIPSIHRLNSIEELPKLIKSSIKEHITSEYLDKYLSLIEQNSFDFDMLEFENQRDRFFYSGGILSDVSITPDKMEDFLKNNDQTFKLIADEYIKKMS